MKINKKHLAFIDEYFVNGFNGTNAYLSVYKGVAPDTARANASKLLANANIKAEIASRNAAISQKMQVTREDLIKDLIDIKENCKTSFPPSSIKAIEVIAKMLGLNEPEKIQHSGEINIGLSVPGLDNAPQIEDVDDLDDDE